jgi:hypothetical protein
MNTAVTLADGQLASTATALSASPLSGLVNITFANVGASTETITLTLSRSGGTARQIAKAAIGVGEQLIVAGLPVAGADTLKGFSTDAASVDYVVYTATDSAEFRVYAVDSSGALKQVNSSQTFTAATTITASSANALTVGPNGTTNPAFQVDDSAGSAATGIKITAAAAGSGVSETVVSSAGNETLRVNAKGSGQMIFGGTSTGLISLGRGSTNTSIFSSTKTSLGTQNTTPTAAQLLGGYIAHTSVTGAGTATLDTAANIDAAIPGVATGDAFECTYANIGTQTVTITTATGLSLKGTAAVGAGKVALLQFYRTGSAAWDVAITVSA